MNFKKEIGRRIRKSRTDKGWTLEFVSGKTLGVLSASRISNYEQGLRLLKPQEALLLGTALGENPAHLMCLDVEDEMTLEEKKLLRDWRKLPERDRNSYARRISALALVYQDSVPDESEQPEAPTKSRVKVASRKS